MDAFLSFCSITTALVAHLVTKCMDQLDFLEAAKTVARNVPRSCLDAEASEWRLQTISEIVLRAVAAWDHKAARKIVDLFPCDVSQTARETLERVEEWYDSAKEPNPLPPTIQGSAEELVRG